MSKEYDTSLWDCSYIKYIVPSIILTYLTFSSSKTFDKIFRTESNSDLLEKIYNEKKMRCVLVPDNLKMTVVKPNKLSKAKCFTF